MFQCLARFSMWSLIVSCDHELSLRPAKIPATFRFNALFALRYSLVVISAETIRVSDRKSR
jgi:hypothetical protein